MRALCLVLSTHIAHSTLLEVTIRVDCGRNHNHDPHDVFDIHTISLLFCFGSIQHLHLKSPGGFRLDDAMVWDMA
jgi:hypothetical protein